MIDARARPLGVAAALTAGATMAIGFWPARGGGRGATAATAAAMTAMAGFAYTVPHRLWPVMPGASLLMISDALLAARLFKGLKSRWAGWAAWWFHIAGQALITWAFLR